MKYIYGIIDLNTKKSFGHCLSTEASVQTDGITTCEEVYAVSYQDISAVVSDSLFVDYTTLLKDEVARYLLRHQQVIEKIMDSHTIIPMRLGTFADNDEEVKEVLTKGYGTIKSIFEVIKESREIDVVATWNDLNSVINEVVEEKEVKEFKEKLISKPEGVSVEDQVKIGSLIKRSLDKKRERCALEIETSLKDLGIDFRRHGLMDDRMVINTAFLISKDKQKDFDRKVEELNTKFVEKLNFRCVGPLPPYSFYTLEVKKWQFKEIDWAKRKLGLQDNLAIKDEIKKAYQALVFSFHPDKNPNTPGTEREFDEVTKAYNLLWGYCQKDSCSFKEDEFKKNAILVRVRG